MQRAHVEASRKTSCARRLADALHKFNMDFPKGLVAALVEDSHEVDDGGTAVKLCLECTGNEQGRLPQLDAGHKVKVPMTLRMPGQYAAAVAGRREPGGEMVTDEAGSAQDTDKMIGHVDRSMPRIGRTNVDGASDRKADPRIDYRSNEGDSPTRRMCFLGAMPMSLVELAAYLATGIVAGLMAGLLGVGGGVVVVPALVWVFVEAGFVADWIFHLAVGTSLATLIGTGSASAYSHHRRGAVRWDLVRVLVPWIVIGAWIGSAIAGLLEEIWLRRIFGIFQIYVGVRMLWPSGKREVRGLPGSLGIGLVGSVIGSLSALLGIGGGTLTVPFLVRSGVDMRRAVATSSACGPPIALAGALGFVAVGWGREGLPPGSTGFVYWPAVAGILLASAPAAPWGARLAHSLPLSVLKRIFAALVLVVGTKLLLG
jgi:uncharacterized membrane protein YfcA